MNHGLPLFLCLQIRTPLTICGGHKHVPVNLKEEGGRGGVKSSFFVLPSAQCTTPKTLTIHHTATSCSCRCWFVVRFHVDDDEILSPPRFSAHALFSRRRRRRMLEGFFFFLSPFYSRLCFSLHMFSLSASLTFLHADSRVFVLLALFFFNC